MRHGHLKLENDTNLHLLFFRPQMSDIAPDHRQQPSLTAKYYIRCELKQFSKYLIGFSFMELLKFY